MQFLTSSSVVGNPPSFIIYTTGFLCVNDSSVSRTSRLKRVLHSYIPKQYLTDEKLRITSFDGTKWGEIERNTFDRVCFSYSEPESIAFAWSNNPDAKTVFTPCFLSRVQVLVDVPCTTDRHSVMENDNSIFNKSRTGERRQLPQLQLELLMYVFWFAQFWPKSKLKVIIIILNKPNPSLLQGGGPGCLSRWCDCLLHMHAFSKSEPECGGTGHPLG